MHTLGEGWEGDTKLVLIFEIVDVYEGTRYDDVAITDLFFDGIDVY